jgi:hypothetical protein
MGGSGRNWRTRASNSTERANEATRGKARRPRRPARRSDQRVDQIASILGGDDAGNDGKPVAFDLAARIEFNWWNFHGLKWRHNEQSDAATDTIKHVAEGILQTELRLGVEETIGDELGELPKAAAVQVRRKRE